MNKVRILKIKEHSDNENWRIKLKDEFEIVMSIDQYVFVWANGTMVLYNGELNKDKFQIDEKDVRYFYWGATMDLYHLLRMKEISRSNYYHQLRIYRTECGPVKTYKLSEEELSMLKSGYDVSKILEGNKWMLN